MAVRTIDIEQLDWASVDASWSGRAAAGKPGVRYKPFAIGAGSVPTGQMVEYEPGHVEGAHSHDEDEILFLTDGCLELDGRSLGPGTLVFIEGGTVYGPLSSEEGCRFLRLHLDR